MATIPNLDSWPKSEKTSITVHEPRDGYKAPLGFAPWPKQEQPSDGQPSPGAGESE